MFAQDLLARLTEIHHSVKVNLTNRKQFILNLHFVYQLMRASEQLLVVAASLATGDLQKFYYDHLQEERGHDKWLLRDLNNAGIEIAPWHSGATKIAGAQYYHVIHTHPAALLGYMMVMEGNPMSLWMIEQLEEIHGKSLLTTVRYHAEHDIEHRDEILRIVNSLSPVEQKVIEEVAIETALDVAKALQEAIE